MCFRMIRLPLLSALLLVAPLSLNAGSADQTSDKAIATENPAAQLAALQQAIRELESSGDTWHPDLAESMISLAAQLQELGDHLGALPLLERTVHLNRVNQGLFGLEQVPALRMQIESHLALGQWDEADGLHQYLFYVHSRALDDSDPALIAALEEYARWNMEAFGQRLGLYPATRLVDAYHLYSVALSIVDRDPELIEQSREHMLQRLAYIAWLMSRTGVLMRPEAQFADVRLVDDNWVDMLTERRYRLSNNPFLQGEYALEQIVEMRQQRLLQAGNEVDSEQRNNLLVAHADAMLDLADWYLMFNRRNAANAAYGRAWNAMEGEDETLRSGVFERIVLLPRFEGGVQPPASSVAAAPRAPDDEPSEETEPVPYVIMKFDIDQFGRAMDVNILESWPEDDTRMQRHLIGALRASRLRPVIREGQATRVQDLVYRFPYVTQPSSTETDDVESAVAGT